MENLDTYKHFTSERSSQMFLFPNVCFKCRKSYKKPASKKPSKCPECGAQMTELSRKFKAPKKDDTAAWHVIEFVVNAGFRYHSVQIENGGQAIYPNTMKEAEEFVRLHSGNRADAF
ncbi:hypothetical protein [Pseudomonas sp.]|uniref:hypothetical protein n=1 Tax=Pseudomonas sp. TaxID=306 RepID=UPI00273710C2|nr:hypothetical protein [Pseudomonas sp.]MDP3815781.1 hypothetical protein [Pseudomonas sp.]